MQYLLECWDEKSKTGFTYLIINLVYEKEVLEAILFNAIKNYESIHYYVVLELVPLKGEKNSSYVPCAIPLRLKGWGCSLFLFQNIRQAALTCSVYMEVLPGYIPQDRLNRIVQHCSIFINTECVSAIHSQ